MIKRLKGKFIYKKLIKVFKKKNYKKIKKRFYKN